MEEAGREEGDRRRRPTVPVVLAAAATLVALIAVSTLIVVLSGRTAGPGEVLREFAVYLVDDDCRGAYGLLDESVQRVLSEEEWCANLPSLAAQLAPDFEIVRIVLQGDGARVDVISEGTEGTWYLDRQDRSWRIRGSGPRVEFPGR